jgi:hypothetical protein
VCVKGIQSEEKRKSIFLREYRFDYNKWSGDTPSFYGNIPNWKEPGREIISLGCVNSFWTLGHCDPGILKEGGVIYCDS